jgi:CRISPR-associated endoribonuclease Cas6
MVYSALSRWTKGTALERIFHRDQGTPPYSISDIIPGDGTDMRRDWSSRQATLPKGASVFFKLSLLTEDVERDFANHMPPKDLRIANQPSLMLEKIMGSDTSSLCGNISEKTIVDEIPPVSDLAVRFLSPTGFNSQGRQIPFPMPELFFSSLIWRWQRLFGDFPWPEVEDKLGIINISRYDLKSAVAKGKKGSLHKGCIGYCRYDLKPLTMEERRAIHALTVFATFSGVGYKTGQGLGQVEITEARE